MLTKFSVKNFKNFKDEIVFDLSKPKEYQFNSKCIKDGSINKVMIYGKNASGKTNLILALFDIVSKLTDNSTIPVKFYKNLLALKDETVDFVYEFLLDGSKIEYKYSKVDNDTFTYEKLSINGNTIVELDRISNNDKINLDWDSLTKSGFDNKLKDTKFSVIKYIYKNSKINDFTDATSKTFVKFINFIENMLMFYSLRGNAFAGFNAERSSHDIFKEIIKRGKIKDFENFLADFGLNYELVESTNGANEPTIDIRYGEHTVNFSLICSSGTLALALFYFWYMDIEKISLLVIDEFDAFYHHELATDMVKKLINNGCQVILSTHNISVMTNDLMRPDCYFNISNNAIKSFNELTNKDLRFAHNLGKLYTSGKFDG